jgi:DNA-binding MarR family transcriptional regulator
MTRHLNASRLSEFRHLILAAQREGNRMLGDGLRHVALTPAQAEVLEVLSRGAPLTLAELGRLLVCETGSPSRLVDALVSRGLVSRETAGRDRRAVALRLTSEGQQALIGAGAAVRRLDEFIGERLTSDEVAELVHLLRRLMRDTAGGRALALRFGDEAEPRSRR